MSAYLCQNLVGNSKDRFCCDVANITLTIVSSCTVITVGLSHVVDVIRECSGGTQCWLDSFLTVATDRTVILTWCVASVGTVISSRTVTYTGKENVIGV